MEKLYNGIILPEVWPPRDIDLYSFDEIKVPYLENNSDIIDINIGRQLFVDDFLISETNLKRTYHKAVKYEGNPVFKPETPLECSYSLPCACPKSGGVWFDKYEQKFRMWYEAGWLHRLAYAESADGLSWTRPDLGLVPGTNEILPGVTTDSTAVFIDYDIGRPEERYKLFVREPGGNKPGFAYVSPDGIHWSEGSPTYPLGDRSTMFYNPFRKKWVYSIRGSINKPGSEPEKNVRVRYYRECDNYLAGAAWGENDQVPWLYADRLDLPEPDGDTPQLYNFDAAAYESVMLGMFQIHKGPRNSVCNSRGEPKITELIMSYSRDGFHYSRPDREAFIPASREVAEFDRGYVQSVGGVCLVGRDELRFYYIGFEGDEGRNKPDGKLNGMHDNASTGIALLRRDGFASLDGTGTITTRKLTVSPDKKYLFINAKAPNGSVSAELLDAEGNTVTRYETENCASFHGDSTCIRLMWKEKTACDFHAGGKQFRLKFTLKNAKLYSFWLSDTDVGGSCGFDAGGSF
jgi:hypothetical protein